MRVCDSCALGYHFCAGGGCECFCDAPDVYWAPDAHHCDVCESCEEDLADDGPNVETIQPAEAYL